MTRWITTLVLLAVAGAAQATADADAITGFWQTDGGAAIIEVMPHGDTYRGRLIWLRESHYPADDPRGIGGEPVTDRHNPDPDKRHRPLIGLPLLTGLTYRINDDNKAEWRGGRIYDSETGKHYDSYVWLADSDHLKLHGYIAVALLGRTTTWTRVADPNVESASRETP